MNSALARVISTRRALSTRDISNRGNLRAALLDEMDLEQWNELTYQQDQEKALKERMDELGILAVFMHQSYDWTDWVLYKDGSEGSASSFPEPYNEVEGYAYYAAQTEKIIKEVGPGPVYCRGQLLTNHSGSVFSGIIHQYKAHQCDCAYQLVTPCTPLGSNNRAHIETGWYCVNELRFPSFRDMMEGLRGTGDERVLEYDRALIARKFYTRNHEPFVVASPHVGCASGYVTYVFLEGQDKPTAEM